MFLLHTPPGGMKTSHRCGIFVSKTCDAPDKPDGASDMKAYQKLLTESTQYLVRSVPNHRTCRFRIEHSTEIVPKHDLNRSENAENVRQEFPVHQVMYCVLPVRQFGLLQRTLIRFDVDLLIHLMYCRPPTLKVCIAIFRAYPPRFSCHGS